MIFANGQKEVHRAPLPPKPFEIGEEVTCRYKPLLWRMDEPVKVMELRPGGMSGWLVGVNSNSGIQFIDSEFFRRKTAVL